MFCFFDVIHPSIHLLKFYFTWSKSAIKIIIQKKKKPATVRATLTTMKIWLFLLLLPFATFFQSECEITNELLIYRNSLTHDLMSWFFFHPCAL